MGVKKGPRAQRTTTERGRKQPVKQLAGQVRLVRKNGRAVHSAEHQARLHRQVRGFAEAGWIPGDTATNDGVKWRWYRDGSDYVIAGRRITGDKVCDDVGNADITDRFSPADVLRIRATR